MSQNNKTEDKSIADVKAKTTDLCIHCNKKLEIKNIGGGSGLFDFASTGSGAFYCNNNSCKFFGVLTLARKQKTEKVVELKEETNKE